MKSYGRKTRKMGHVRGRNGKKDRSTKHDKGRKNTEKKCESKAAICLQYSVSLVFCLMFLLTLKANKRHSTTALMSTSHQEQSV